MESSGQNAGTPRMRDDALKQRQQGSDLPTRNDQADLLHRWGTRWKRTLALHGEQDRLVAGHRDRKRCEPACVRPNSDRAGDLPFAVPGLVWS